MSNNTYPLGRQGFLEGQIAWLTDTIVTVLVDTNAYTYSPNHLSLADIPAAARVATSGTLSGRTSTAGVADADDITFFAVSAGTVAEAVVVYKSTSTELTSRLIAYYDQAQGLPATTTGGNISVFWDNGTNRMFSV